MSLNELAAAACALRDALRNRGVLLNDHIESEPKQIADHNLSIAVARTRAALAATLRREVPGLNEQVRIAIDRLSRIVSANHWGAGADFRRMESDAGTAVNVLIKAGANVAVPDASQAESIAEDVPQTMPLSVVVQTCGESLSAYVALRAELFRSLVASRSLGGGPWRIQFTRDPASGVSLRHPRVDYHVGELTGLPDQPSKVVAVLKKVETFAPFRGFCFLNASGGRPEEGSEARVAELRMQFLLGEMLHTVMVLTACLETLELGAQELGLTTDTSPLTKLATALPAFPYWSKVSRNQAYYDEVLATEGVLVENARVTLRMLINEQTSREMEAARQDRADLVEVKPKYDADRRELLVDDIVVKRFRQRAHNQEAVLRTFEEFDWQKRIDAPVPERKVGETVKCLNRNLERIRFERDGTGEGICWYPEAALQSRTKLT